MLFSRSVVTVRAANEPITQQIDSSFLLHNIVFCFFLGGGVFMLLNVTRQHFFRLSVNTPIIGCYTLSNDKLAAVSVSQLSFSFTNESSQISMCLLVRFVSLSSAFENFIFMSFNNDRTTRSLAFCWIPLKVQTASPEKNSAGNFFSAEHMFMFSGVGGHIWSHHHKRSPWEEAV